MNLLRPRPPASIALRRTRFYLRILCVAVPVVVAVLVTAHAALGGVLAAHAPRGGLPSVWAVSPPSAFPSFRWPLAGTPAVVVPFDPPAQPWLPGHRGVDLASEPGAKVYAAGAGTVAFAGIVAGVGVVSVDHVGGLRTTYEPVQPSVHAGERVAMGGAIGVLLAGHPSCPAGVSACLHWGLRRGSVYLDPLLLLGLAPVRLLPSGPRFAGSRAVRTAAPVAGRRPGGRTRPGGCRSARRSG